MLPTQAMAEPDPVALPRPGQGHVEDAVQVFATHIEDQADFSGRSNSPLQHQNETFCFFFLPRVRGGRAIHDEDRG